MVDGGVKKLGYLKSHYNDCQFQKPEAMTNDQVVHVHIYIIITKSLMIGPLRQ